MRDISPHPNPLPRGEGIIESIQRREREKIMADTTVTTRKNGPLLVQGGIKIMDADGNEIAIDGDNEMVFPVPLRRVGQQAVLRRDTPASGVRGVDSRAEISEWNGEDLILSIFLIRLNHVG